MTLTIVESGKQQDDDDADADNADEVVDADDVDDVDNADLYIMPFFGGIFLLQNCLFAMLYPHFFYIPPWYLYIIWRVGLFALSAQFTLTKQSQE